VRKPEHYTEFSEKTENTEKKETRACFAWRRVAYSGATDSSLPPYLILFMAALCLALFMEGAAHFSCFDDTGTGRTWVRREGPMEREQVEASLCR
jgi:hypothetical protein